MTRQKATPQTLQTAKKNKTKKTQKTIETYLRNLCIFIRNHKYIYCKISVAETSLGPWKYLQDMGSLSQRGLILAPGQESNGDNLGIPF